MKKEKTRSKVWLKALFSHYLAANFDWYRNSSFSSLLSEFQNGLCVCVCVLFCSFQITTFFIGFLVTKESASKAGLEIECDYM